MATQSKVSWELGLAGLLEGYRGQAGSGEDQGSAGASGQAQSMGEVQTRHTLQEGLGGICAICGGGSAGVQEGMVGSRGLMGSTGRVGKDQGLFLSPQTPPPPPENLHFHPSSPLLQQDLFAWLSAVTNTDKSSTWSCL